ITLTLMRPPVMILALLGIGRIFYGDFGMIYAIIGDNGILFPTTDVIDTYAFRALRQLGNFSMSAAVVVYQSCMGLVTILIFNAIARKVDADSRLF
ncbi:sugar ABC transporter permease, partial [Clostridium perfringens]